jgi:hypothetical protein
MTDHISRYVSLQRPVFYGQVWGLSGKSTHTFLLWDKATYWTCRCSNAGRDRARKFFAVLRNVQTEPATHQSS